MELVHVLPRRAALHTLTSLDIVDRLEDLQCETYQVESTLLFPS